MTATTTYPTREELNARRAACKPLTRVAGVYAPDGCEFPWGPIVGIHKIGDIAVVEYLRDCSNLTSAHIESYDDHGKTFYSAYLRREDGTYRNIRSYRSLDSALVGAIAVKRDGDNTRADVYFDRMTGATP